MKEHFGPALERVNVVAKENPSPEELEQKLDEELKSVPLSETETLADMIPEAARVKVFELQQEKQAIMKWLHDRLADIDAEKSIEGFEKKENCPHYTVNGDMGVKCEDGKIVPVTKGIVATDAEWGIQYSLNAGVPRDVKKQFVVAEAKRAMITLVNKQIGTAEMERPIPVSVKGGPIEKYLLERHDDYKGWANKGLQNNENVGENNFGVIAEIVVSSLMEQLRIDERLPYQLTKGDVFDDNERKIDFFIRIPAHIRGVKAKADDFQHVGIQFYAGHKNSPVSKQNQINESKERFGLNDIDDIVLISINLKILNNIYHQWKNSGMKPGGPTQLLITEIREKIFRGVLDRFFEPEAIDEMWQNRKTNRNEPKEEEREIQVEAIKEKATHQPPADESWVKQKPGESLYEWVDRVKAVLDARAKQSQATQKKGKEIPSVRLTPEFLERLQQLSPSLQKRIAKMFRDPNWAQPKEGEDETVWIDRIIEEAIKRDTPTAPNVKKKKAKNETKVAKEEDKEK